MDYLDGATPLLVEVLQRLLRTDGESTRSLPPSDFMPVYTAVFKHASERVSALVVAQRHRRLAEWLLACLQKAATGLPDIAEEGALRADALFLRLCKGDAKPALQILGSFAALRALCPAAAERRERLAAVACVSGVLVVAAARAGIRTCPFLPEEAGAVSSNSPIKNIDRFTFVPPELWFEDPAWSPQDLKVQALGLKDGYACTVDGLLTPREIAWWQEGLDLAQEQGLLTSLESEFPDWYRSGNRMLVRESKLSDLLWKRLQPVLRRGDDWDPALPDRPFGFGVSTSSNWQPCGVNSVLRTVRYGENQGFNLHRDANHVASATERSCLTAMIYLDEGFGKGDLVFVEGEHELSTLELPALLSTTDSIPAEPWWRRESTREVKRLTPREGLCVLFDHRLLHYAEPIVGPASKSILRADVVFKVDGPGHGFYCSRTEQLVLGRVTELARMAELAEERGDLDRSLLYYEAAHEVRYCFPLTKEQECEFDVPTVDVEGVGEMIC
eukprot:TRINITY_DN17055_c0_g1_i1.p1 TRINITY_DN17055_c0_g1~~TRINITY_DN17055_c0_g1_i1.p1  ORF type:complete len:501 (+),score=120.62 TRINITY_DN17055_c0_g1_i1:384-1886(+)